MSGQDTAQGGAETIEILLIDDNSDYLLLIRRALEHRDARVRVTGVGSPDEALEVLRRRTFDLVLLDYKFPRGGNGLQLIRALKHETTYIPTVMVTAFGDESLAIQAMRDGALDFVPKTSDFIQALPDVVARAIDRGRIIRERISTQRVLERANRELEALLDIAMALNATVSREDILKVVRTRLGSLLGATESCAHLASEDGGTLHRIGDGPAPAVIEASPSAEFIGARVAVSGRAELTALQDVTLLAVPVVSNERVLGAITFWTEDTDAAAREIDLCAAVGRQAGVALEHDRLYRALARTDRRLRDLVDNAGDEVVTTDADGVILSWNAGAADIYGWTAAEVIGRPWAVLWPEGRASEADDLLRRVLRTGETVRNHETVRTTRDGQRADILLTLSPLTSESGSVTGVSCIGKNITVQKQLHAQLIQSEKMVTVGQLISGVAHELNNPLTAVLGYAQLITEADVGARLPAYLQKVATEAQRAQRIVQNLLAFARKHEPRATRVSINDVVKTMLDLAGYDLRVSGLDVQVDLDERLPTTLADPHQLQQVFLNLVTNARHAMRDTGAQGKLRITTRQEFAEHEGRQEIVVRFIDNGPGVPVALRERIFDPFFTTKDVGEGTGLGLSLAYGIVTEHGGRLAVTDGADGGACFEIHLPVMPEIAAAERRGASARATGRRRILVVDDQSALTDAVSRALAGDDHDIETAGDATQALDRIATGDSFDLILVDLHVAEFSGDRLRREVANIRPDLARRMVVTDTDGHAMGGERSGRSGGWSLPRPCGAEDIRRTVTAFFEPTHPGPAGRRESA